jgi:glycosyltransferase involved in cell wall biosynthesis
MLLENRPYPQDIRVRSEANALTSAGYSVSVICPADPGQRFRETIAGVHVFRYPAPQAATGLLGYLWEYGYSLVTSFLLSVMVFLGEGFDVIHAHNPPETFVFIALFYKPFGKRFIFDHHDLSPEMYEARFPGGSRRLVRAALVALEKLTCRSADHIIATNESYKKLEMERSHVPESRITVVRNGVGLENLNFAEPDRALREKGKTIIGYVGVIGFQDGVDYLLRALKHLRDLGRSDFYCVIIGDGDAWAYLKTLTTELGLDDYVWLPGAIFGAPLRRYLAAADICVDSSPSNSYNDRSTACKLMEYMALGKPMVVFDLPEHRFSADRAAVFVRPNDERAFAAAIVGLMDDPCQRVCLGVHGMRRIKTHLAWEYSVSNLLKVYRSVLPARQEDPGSSLEKAA